MSNYASSLSSIRSPSSGLRIILLFLSLLQIPWAAGQVYTQNNFSTDNLKNNVFSVQAYRSNSYWVPSPDQVANFVLELELQQGQALSAGFVQALRNGLSINGLYGAYGNTALNSTDQGLVFTTSIRVGTQTFQVVVDTGSSDTWLANAGFQCSAPGTGDLLPQSACKFGPLYTPATTFKPIANENFYVDYSDGEALSGTFGTEAVTVAGIRIPQQQIASVSGAAWYGDGITSGLLGLAFPANTRAYRGSDVRQDSAKTQVPYNPVFTSMYKQSSIPPLFSIALNRNTGGGSLAFGGLAPVPHTYPFASSPLQILTTSTSSSGSSSGASSSSPSSNIGSGQYTLYTITVGGFVYDTASPSHWSGAQNPITNTSSAGSSPQVQVIIDSGTTIMSLPTAAADAINALFNPKPFYRDDSGYYIIPCTSTAPRVGVKIGGQTFYINAKDMVINEGGGRCISGVGATLGAGGVNVLGHTFLKNVLAVFDVGANMMRFAARENY